MLIELKQSGTLDDAIRQIVLTIAWLHGLIPYNEQCCGVDLLELPPVR